MCEFFSLVSDGNGNPMYFNWEQRLGILNKEKEFKNVESADSHTSIASFYGFTGEKEDKLNKYEYNPITKKFINLDVKLPSDLDEFIKKQEN